MAMQEGRLAFSAHPLDSIIKNLCELPGIGPWTAHYIAMRGYRDPDAFPIQTWDYCARWKQRTGAPPPQKC